MSTVITEGLLVERILTVPSNSIVKHNTGGRKFLGSLRYNLYDNIKVYVKMRSWCGFIQVWIWATEGFLRTR
jgi:hypothetical protein